MQTIYKRIDYTIDIPDLGTPIDIDELQSIVTRAGSHFFDRDTMRFFRSRVDRYTFTAPDGWYFITSEKHEAAFANINEPRRYTVRCLRVVGGEVGRLGIQLVELEGFQAFPTLDRARTAARNAAQSTRPICTSCHSRLSTDDAQTVCTECTQRAIRIATAK